MIINKTSPHLRLLASSVLVGIASTVHAVELPLFGSKAPSVDIHGFASQGFIWNTGDNDYLGGDSSGGTYDFRDYAINFSTARGKWRVGAQFFGQKLGPYGNDKMTLDWGNVDYQAAQWFGLRAGRVKMPRGLYNEALDLDFTRPFVFLPQSVYDARLRDFQASFDGGMAYGNVSLKKAGSLDYKAYFGTKSISTSSGASDYFNQDAPFPNISIGMDDVWGASAFWNTPLQGFRVGYSFTRFDNFDTVRHVPPPRDMDAHKLASTYDRHLFSMEYTVGDWVFAAEGGFEDTDYDVVYPGQPVTVFLYPRTYYYYVSAAWRANRWLELGAYYSQYHFDQGSAGTPFTFPDLNQRDYALSARVDLTEHLLLKVEGHYMHGAGAVFDVPSQPQPPSQRDDSWFLLATKVTVSF